MCFSFGVLVCVWVNLASLVAIVLHLCCASSCNFSSIVLWMYSHELSQKLVRAMWREYISRVNFCFLMCRYFISSLIRIFVIFFWVCLWAGEVLGIFMLAYVGVSCFFRHSRLKCKFAVHL